MTKKIRIRKKAEQKVTFDMLTPEQRVALDRDMMNIVTKILFEDSQKDELDLQKDVIDKSNVIFPQKEVERIWNVLIGSTWISPIVGFGKAGKLELTNAGLQMMSQYGSYKNFLMKQEGISDNEQRLQADTLEAPQQITEYQKSKKLKDK